MVRLKMAIPWKVFNAILIKIIMAFFTEMEKKNPYICMKPQVTPNSQTILK
jgi:hypothetical protein